MKLIPGRVLKGLRRSFGAALLAVATSVQAAGVPAAAPTGAAVQIGYMPIIADTQVFVIAQGLTQEKPFAQARMIEFQSGPEIVQALLSGQLDVAYVGAGPAMVARAAGADVRFVAGNDWGATRLLAVGKLAEAFAKGSPEQAVARFTQEQGRKPILTTFPLGSVPAAALRNWLLHQTHVGFDAVQLVYQGENQVVQALLTGAVDGAAALDPAIDIVLARRPDARVVAGDQVLFPEQPGAGLLVREALIREHPAFVEQLVRAQIEATQLLKQHPEKAVPAVQKYLGGGRLSAAIVRESMSHVKYEADPRELQRGTEKLYAFQSQQGVLKKPLDVSTLFDASFYERLTHGEPNGTH
ncbi:MAG: ABC transporter substrate-binding protein [Castellaniella sp.]|uniref:ABC transporter substrate-binding protein n=1 Tax=Castellaniella sp. TaxID=1955812 RepID=UPI00121E329B|nr:ABC transporter substrate-binding protein [Castellaniella sp.]TAN29536.1 MAG: ABC transporter substrate-binding protein [Castellaniella sp.]